METKTLLVTMEVTVPKMSYDPEGYNSHRVLNCDVKEHIIAAVQSWGGQMWAGHWSTGGQVKVRRVAVRKKAK